MITRSKFDTIKQNILTSSSIYLVYDKPTSVKKALVDLDWKASMQLEYDALIKNGIWYKFLHQMIGKLLTTRRFFKLE